MENKNKIKIVGIVVVVLIIFGLLSVNVYNEDSNQYKQLTTLQQSILLRYGLDDIYNVRSALDGDIDTGIKIRDNYGKPYAVFRSRHFETGDYGKLFASSLN